MQPLPSKSSLEKGICIIICVGSLVEVRERERGRGYWLGWLLDEDVYMYICDDEIYTRLEACWRK